MKLLLRTTFVLLLAVFGGLIIAATIMGYRRPVMQYVGRQPVIGVVFDRGQFCTFVGEVRVNPPTAAPTTAISVITYSTTRAVARTFGDEEAAYSTRPRLTLLPGQQGTLIIAGTPTQGADAALGDRYQLV